MLKPDLKKILDYLNQMMGLDFSGYREGMLERRTQKRLYKTACENLGEYFIYLTKNPQELEFLIDVYTINVSSFYRNALTYEILRKEVFPSLLEQKQEETNRSIRIWSAGCAKGEEPYSIAIVFEELLEKVKSKNPIYILGTDIDNKSIVLAKKAVYSENSIENLKHKWVKKYFSEKEQGFQLNDSIRDLVQFSNYNLLNVKQKVPPESIFGDFDIVFCRNVLIYFNETEQKLIFEKLYHAIRPNGYLVLGEAEVPIADFKHKFRRLGRHCKIYKKVSFY